MVDETVKSFKKYFSGNKKAFIILGALIIGILLLLPSSSLFKEEAAAPESTELSEYKAALEKTGLMSSRNFKNAKSVIECMKSKSIEYLKEIGAENGII